jgi:hypothetical protein
LLLARTRIAAERAAVAQRIENDEMFRRTAPASHDNEARAAALFVDHKPSNDKLAEAVANAWERIAAWRTASWAGSHRFPHNMRCSGVKGSPDLLSVALRPFI